MKKLLLLLSSVVVAACGSSGGESSGNSPEDVVAAGLDAGSGRTQGDAGFQFGPPDGGNDAAVEPDAGPPAADTEGRSEANYPPCIENDDCDSGWCVQSPDGGNVCTETCIDACPLGWKCAAVSNTGGDVTYICVPRWLALCRPCNDSNECGLSDSVCHEYGAAGHFCATSCLADSDCPQDYQCQSELCVLGEGECQCSPADIKIGASTKCSTSNELGTCEGERSCSEAGLSDCVTETPMAEICDGIDNDCDGVTDEDTSGQSCTVENEFGSCTGISTCAAAFASCDAPEPSEESCDGVDNDCDGTIDEDSVGCTVFYLDNDGDGFGQDEFSQCFCGPQGKYTAFNGGDCNDGNANANPMATESCDGVDNNCNQEIDELGSVGCVNFYTDFDKDGFGKSGTQVCQCGPTAESSTKEGGDCNDSDIDVYPGAPEICGGGDEDCDGIPDEEGAGGCKIYYRDVDGDGWGVESQKKCLCVPTDLYTADQFGDCDDNSKQSYPGGTEICDGADNNCNVLIDEGSPTGCVAFWVDADGDGFAAEGAASSCKCAAQAPYTAQKTGDCNDGNAKINPTESEICDGLDNNCNNQTDEGFPDTDSDGSKDCLDTDDDNDGTPDVSDCQPTNSAVPSCSGKQCGQDGCGNSCGTCSALGCTVPQDSCMVLGRCQSIVSAEKSASSQWTCTSCGDVDFSGQCWADDIVVWCASGVLSKLQCSTGGKCIFNSEYQWYDCTYPWQP